MDKKEIRKKIKQQRMAMSLAEVNEKSEKILRNLITTVAYKEAKLILLYISSKNEVDTGLVIEQAFEDGKILAAPRVNGDRMEFIIFDSFKELKPGAFGILEPKGHRKAEAEFDRFGPNEILMLMPGVAFDEKHNRIGQGGGYYDRYLSETPLKTLALFYDFQMVESIEAEAFDVKPDIIVTETRIF